MKSGITLSNQTLKPAMYLIIFFGTIIVYFASYYIMQYLGIYTVPDNFPILMTMTVILLIALRLVDVAYRTYRKKK
jgi:uncharacterized membrane protein